MKLGIYNWEKTDSYDEKYICKIGRFTATIWKFGDIHQCKVFIKYKHLIEGKEYKSLQFDDQVGISLMYAKTRNEAMQRATDWIETFKKRGLLSSNKLFKKMEKNYPVLFPDRNRILSHLFFTIGNGYAWLDGGLIELSPSGHTENKAQLKKFDEFEDIIRRAKESGKAARLLLGIAEEEEELDTREIYEEKVWKGDKLPFYPVSEDYSNICCVPDDVQGHWLKLAYESAILLRDKSGVPDIDSQHNSFPDDYAKRQEKNREIGAQVVADLERRFSDGIEKIQ